MNCGSFHNSAENNIFFANPIHFRKAPFFRLFLICLTVSSRTNHPFPVFQQAFKTFHDKSRGGAFFNDGWATDIRGLATARQSFVVELPLSVIWSLKVHSPGRTRILQTETAPLPIPWRRYSDYFAYLLLWLLFFMQQQGCDGQCPT